MGVAMTDIAGMITTMTTAIDTWKLAHAEAIAITTPTFGKVAATVITNATVTIKLTAKEILPSPSTHGRTL